MTRLGPALVLAVLALTPQAPPTNYDEAKVPAYVLPPLLVTAGGGRVDARSWSRRRAEIQSLLESQMFGRSPARPGRMAFELVSVDRKALGGQAIRKEVAIRLEGRTLNLLVYLPANAGRPVPVFVGLGFGPNQTVNDDPGIRMAGLWARDKATGTIALQPPEQSPRGSTASRWQVEKLIARGYGLARMYYGDVEPDIPGAMKLGVRGSGLQAGRDAAAGREWGAIAAWAWGLSRAADYLATDKEVDARRLAVIGHSRLGKTALWAGAIDSRFAMVISNDSGEGGAAISRRVFGETVADLNTRFPHWFCANYAKWNGREAEMPFDAHMLLALAAPRPLYVASAQDDQWADPKGEFLGAVAASEVYELLGRKGLGTKTMPPVNTPVGDTVRYHVRTGKHDITAYDWDQYLAFADRHFKRIVP